ncbi:MAG: type II secretion system F family protein [Fimbriimonadaceae bacterium]|nr:type II secretion system F family protein [Fimbriimonadaceae bacterium]
MPFFQYQATDKQGNPIQGTVQASDVQEASRALALQGFRVSDLREPGAAPPIARPATAPPNPIESVRPSGVALQPPAAKPIGPIRKTRKGTDKDTYFLFSQIASYLKAGTNPATAFAEVGRKYPRSDYREAFQMVAAKVTEGKGIAEIMEQYPYLFSPNVVGQVRAGEYGGYLPEAMDSIVDQADASRKMRRWFLWLGISVFSILPSYLIGKGLLGGVLRSWDTQEATGGTAPVGPAVMAGIVKEFSGPLGIFSIVSMTLLIVGIYVWQQMPLRVTRHRLALAVPTVGKRARAEAFAAFAWNLSHLGKAGITPIQSWQLAADTVPNQAIRETLLEQRAHMNDRTKLSEALQRTKMLPYEFGAMVQTGEITGDIAGQLMNGARSQQDEFRYQDNAAKKRAGCWIALVNVAFAALLFFWLYSDLLLGVMDKFSKE